MLIPVGISAATSARKVGVAAPPLVGPAYTRFAFCVVIVKLSAGVVVGLLTAVVNNGFAFPALKFVSVPAPPVDAQPVALPFAKIPVGACPVEHRDGVEARAAAVVAAIVPDPVTPNEPPLPIKRAAVFVPAVIALKATEAVELAISVRVVTLPTRDGVQVIFVPHTTFKVGSCV